MPVVDAYFFERTLLLAILSLPMTTPQLTACEGHISLEGLDPVETIRVPAVRG
jgi:hypothetical protein